jgi:hypothetical protein
MEIVRDHARPCSVCGEPVDLEVAHNPHAEDCPARQQLRAVCECDIWVHPECCPECAPAEEC